MGYKKLIDFVRRAHAGGLTKPEILDRLEAYYCLTDEQARSIYKAAQ